MNSRIRPQAVPPLAGVTGVILAGGASSRMGSNKALLPSRQGRFIQSVYRRLTTLFDDVLVVTNTPEQYSFLGCRKVADIYSGMGALAGIHAGLRHCATTHIFVSACDMPNLNEELIRYLAGRADGHDVAIPESPHGVEPLHAVYGVGALPAIEEVLDAGKRRIVSFFPRVRLQLVGQAEVARLDPEFRSFRNINTPEEYYRFRNEESIPHHHIVQGEQPGLDLACPK